MENIYDYEDNITLTKTANGDAVITMNKAILDEITCMLYDAANKAHHDGHEATAKDWQRMINVLVEKEKEAKLW